MSKVKVPILHYLMVTVPADNFDEKSESAFMILINHSGLGLSLVGNNCYFMSCISIFIIKQKSFIDFFLNNSG